MFNRVKRVLWWGILQKVFLASCVLAIPLVFSFGSVHGIAKQSTLSMTISADALAFSITPTADGAFGKTSNNTISITTDNFTGYTLSVSSSTSTSMENSNHDAITTISSAIDESTFANGSAYKNKWGYKPNQYVTTSGGVHTTVPNTDYLPAPSLAGDLLAVTTAANSTADIYTISFGAKVDTTMPAGQYTYTYVLAAIANTITYNISYDDNTTETVTHMPNPNPQALTVDGGTPAASSHAALSDAVPTMTTDDMSFGGWCDVATTIDGTTGNYLCSGTTYQPGDDYPIDQTVDGTNIELYAIWLEDTFPMVWSQMGACEFADYVAGDNKHHGSVAGSECADYAGGEYIDTGIALYSNANYQKDYEVHFTIDEYAPGSQHESQATLFNDKLSTSTGGGSSRTAPYYGRAPGLVVRRNSGNGLEIKSTYGGDTNHAGTEATRTISKTPVATAYNGTDVRIFRIDGVIYTSVDNGPLIELQDYTSFDQQFGLTAWFGAYPDNVDCSENCTAAKRFFTGQMSNMYIKLGDFPSSGIHDITFDGNGGTPATTSYKIVDGDALGDTLPEVTRSGWLFDGWYTTGGQAVTSATVPTADATYSAHWYKSVTDAQITNTNIQLSVAGTETITITNSADIEPYTLVSNDTSVATVNQATGVVTAVGYGMTTITMTGTKTGDTRTINVSVGVTITVDFDSQGGTPATYQWDIVEGSSFSDLPTPLKTGYTVEGWYTGTNGTGTKLTTSTVFTTNTPTQYYANWQEAVYVCKIAKQNTLHIETCDRTTNDGCRAATNNGVAISYGAEITYGSIPASSTKTPGDAYDCDINNDQDWDATTERFYYIGTDNNTGNDKFIYYRNLSTTNPTYADAPSYLPTASDPDWDNPNLVTFNGGDYNNTVARFMTYPEALPLCDNSTSANLGSDGRCIYLLESSAFANTGINDGIWMEAQSDGYKNRIQTRSRQLNHNKTTANNEVRPTIEVPSQYVEPYSATYQITFDPHNETSTWSETINAGSQLGNAYPSTNPTYTDHLFQGWYTAASGGTLVTNQTTPDSSTTYHAQWLKTVTLATLGSNSISVAEGATSTISVTNAAELEPYSFSSLDSTKATVDASTGVVTGVAAGSTSIRMTGTTSTAYIDIPVTVTTAPSTYQITFNPHNGDSSWSETVNVGSQLGNAYPANDPTYTDHVFQGWWTADTGGTLVTSSTTPDGNLTYHGQWKGTVALANITNTNISVGAGSSETIAVTNTSDIEPYSFSSNDTTVATVDSSTGAVTGVGAGSTTITMTGNSGATRTINVTVTAATVTIHFNPHGGESVPDRTINLGDTVGTPLPSAPTYDNNHLFQGWFTADSGGTQIDGSERPSVETTYHAQWKKTVSLADLDSDDITVVEEGTATIVVNNSSELEGYTFSSANSSVASVDANTGVITGHVESITTITMTGTTSGQTKTINVRVVTEQNPYVCTLAVAGSLHSANNITYGQIANNTTPQPGDAYDCDVDYDGTYSPTTERFYYLGTDSNTNAVLLAYNSYYNDAWAPGVPGSSGGDSVFSYSAALEQLPSNASGKWDNPYLVEQATGKAARLMTKAEVENACPGVTVTGQNNLVSCPFFMEHSAYDDGGRSAYWLAPEGNTYWRVHAGSSNRNVASISNPNNSNNMSRPVIVVPYARIEKYVVPPAQTYTVTYNSMGGSSVGQETVEGGTALGQHYPSTDPTKTDNMFFGWYDTASYTNEVTPETVVNGDVTYYAKWVGNTSNFPIVWSEKNACTFGGAGVNVSGDYCTQLKTRDYVDTGIALYNSTNYDSDYEIGFKVVSFTPSASQETLFNEKYENSSAYYPGIMLRSNGANTDMSHKISNTTATATATALSTLTDVKIVRQSGVVKYSFNGGTLTDLQNLNQLTRQEFDTAVWFGASATDSNVSQRQSHSTLTDMYIRLGSYEAVTSYNITFDGRGGTPSESLRPVQAGQQVGTLPTVTRAGNYTFLGWFDENDNPVTASTTPTKNETYHADWSFTPSNVPVVFDTSNDAMTGYYDIIENWTGSPVNITQFNKNTTTINNSTWGDTSELSEAGFQSGLRANFENYNCDMQRDYNGSSESKWNWNSGTVNCSKPKVYDTGVNDALTVYLYDTTNSTVGNKVYYTKSSNGTITNLVPGKTYKWEQTSDNTVYGYVTATADHGTRFIDAGSTNNVRDLGGLEVDTDDDGVVDGTLKYEILYRGGKVVGGSAGVEALTNLAKVTDVAAGDLIEYDVAGDQPAGFPLAESYPVIHYNFDYNANDLTNYNAARTAINAIMDEVIGGGKVYFHCRVGADRTGTVAYLLEGLLGVSDEDRYREYELTHLGGLSDRTRYYKQKDSGNNKKFVFMMDYLQTKGDIMTWYMKGSSDTEFVHPDQDRIDDFRQAMIE